MIFFLFYSRKGKIFSFRAFCLLKNMPKPGAMTVPAFNSTKEKHTMASKKLPTNGGLFILLIKKMIAGIIKLGDGVPITLVTVDEMQPQLDLFSAKNDS